MVAAIVREDGTLQLYNDYNPVSMSRVCPKTQKQAAGIIDIEADFTKFYFKKEDETSLNQFIWSKLAVDWSSRLNIDMAEVHKPTKFKKYLHNRIRRHFNLYTTLFSYGVYLFVGHRNYVSTYNFMSLTFEDPIEFKKWVRTIGIIDMPV
jgi:hypothetical protein